MSFSTNLKNELISIETSACCKKAEAFGMLIFGRSFSLAEISLLTKNKKIADRYIQHITDLTGVVPVIETTKAQNYKIYVESLKDRTKLLNFFGYTGKELKQQINLGNLEQTEEECCSKAFLRGAFLVCGSITDPEKDYHIEFSVQRIALADGLMQIIDSLDMKCERLLRNSSCIVYSKDAAAYEDFVGHIGAARAYMEIIQIRATKDIKNQINRRANFEAANMARSIEAGLKQIALIESILEKISLSDMTDDLQQLCTLRMDNPDISLDELGSLMTPPLSRSAVGRRIKKLESISRELNSQ